MGYTQHWNKYDLIKKTWWNGEQHVVVPNIRNMTYEVLMGLYWFTVWFFVMVLGWGNLRNISTHHSHWSPCTYGGFHKWEVSQNRWFIWENPSRNGWWTGVPPFMETPNIPSITWFLWKKNILYSIVFHPLMAHQWDGDREKNSHWNMV